MKSLYGFCTWCFFCIFLIIAFSTKKSNGIWKSDWWIVCWLSERFCIVFDRSHSAQAFVALWQQRALDGREKMACQGQSYALISVHHWTAGLTPVPFTLEASEHYVCVLCFLSCLLLLFLSHYTDQPSESACTMHCPAITPHAWLTSQSNVTSRRRQ